MWVKTILTLLLLTCSLQPLSAADMTIRVGGPSMQWAWGQDTVITIPVELVDGPSLAAARVRVKYDGNLLTFLQVDKGKALKSANALPGHTLNEPGQLTMNFTSTEGVTGQGNLFLLKFSVIPSGINGSSSPIEVTEKLAWRADNEADIVIESSDGGLNLFWQILALPLSWLVGGGVGIVVLLFLLRRLMRGKTKSEKAQAQPAA